MNIFALLVPSPFPLPPPSPPSPSHVPFCQCIDPTCILWSKLAFDIYAGCQVDRATASEDFTMPLLSPAPLDAIVISGSTEQEEEQGSSICACYCHLCFCFPFRFPHQPPPPSFLPTNFAWQNYRYSVGRSDGSIGWVGFRFVGSRSQPFWPIQLATETIQSSPANAPRRAFSFCYLCI